MSTPAKNPQFLFIFRHAAEGPDPTPQEMEQILEKWMAWIKSIGARGQLAGVNRLQETGNVLRGPAGSLTDGPYVEAKEIVGGYLLVNAPDLAAANTIARGCPGLALNRTIVEVRPVQPLPAI